jgi:hypothetical protein
MVVSAVAQKAEGAGNEKCEVVTRGGRIPAS